MLSEAAGPLLVAKTLLGFHSARFDFDAQRPQKSYVFLCHGELSAQAMARASASLANDARPLRVFEAAEGFWMISGPLLTFKESTRQSLFTANHADGRVRTVVGLVCCSCQSNYACLH